MDLRSHRATRPGRGRVVRPGRSARPSSRCDRRGPWTPPGLPRSMRYLRSPSAPRRSGTRSTANSAVRAVSSAPPSSSTRSSRPVRTGPTNQGESAASSCSSEESTWAAARVTSGRIDSSTSRSMPPSGERSPPSRASSPGCLRRGSARRRWSTPFGRPPDWRRPPAAPVRERATTGRRHRRYRRIVPQLHRSRLVPTSGRRRLGRRRRVTPQRQRRRQCGSAGRTPFPRSRPGCRSAALQRPRSAPFVGWS